MNSKFKCLEDQLRSMSETLSLVLDDCVNLKREIELNVDNSWSTKYSDLKNSIRFKNALGKSQPLLNSFINRFSTYSTLVYVSHSDDICVSDHFLKTCDDSPVFDLRGYQTLNNESQILVNSLRRAEERVSELNETLKESCDLTKDFNLEKIISGATVEVNRLLFPFISHVNQATKVLKLNQMSHIVAIDSSFHSLVVSLQEMCTKKYLQHSLNFQQLESMRKRFISCKKIIFRYISQKESDTRKPAALEELNAAVASFSRNQDHVCFGLPSNMQSIVQNHKKAIMDECKKDRCQSAIEGAKMYLSESIKITERTLRTEIPADIMDFQNSPTASYFVRPLSNLSTILKKEIETCRRTILEIDRLSFSVSSLNTPLLVLQNLENLQSIAAKCTLPRFPFFYRELKAKAQFVALLSEPEKKDSYPSSPASMDTPILCSTSFPMRAQNVEAPSLCDEIKLGATADLLKELSFLADIPDVWESGVNYIASLDAWKQIYLQRQNEFLHTHFSKMLNQLLLLENFTTENWRKGEYDWQLAKFEEDEEDEKSEKKNGEEEKKEESAPALNPHPSEVSQWMRQFKILKNEYFIISSQSIPAVTSARQNYNLHLLKKYAADISNLFLFVTAGLSPVRDTLDMFKFLSLSFDKEQNQTDSLIQTSFSQLESFLKFCERLLRTIIARNLDIAPQEKLTPADENPSDIPPSSVLLGGNPHSFDRFKDFSLTSHTTFVELFRKLKLNESDLVGFFKILQNRLKFMPRFVRFAFFYQLTYEFLENLAKDSEGMEILLKSVITPKTDDCPEPLPPILRSTSFSDLGDHRSLPLSSGGILQTPANWSETGAEVRVRRMQARNDDHSTKNIGSSSATYFFGEMKQFVEQFWNEIVSADHAVNSEDIEKKLKDNIFLGMSAIFVEHFESSVTNALCSSFLDHLLSTAQSLINGKLMRKLETLQMHVDQSIKALMKSKTSAQGAKLVQLRIKAFDDFHSERATVNNILLDLFNEFERCFSFVTAKQKEQKDSSKGENSPNNNLISNPNFICGVVLKTETAFALKNFFQLIDYFAIINFLNIEIMNSFLDEKHDFDENDSIFHPMSFSPLMPSFNQLRHLPFGLNFFDRSRSSSRDVEEQRRKNREQRKQQTEREAEIQKKFSELNKMVLEFDKKRRDAASTATVVVITFASTLAGVVVLALLGTVVRRMISDRKLKALIPQV
eukprot:GDKJ01018662.1.p1 GENE.GDKJ01018662.1~~GDKJ01018662.1.p1  ORF type:complete len:1270 (-),score=295.80 GDKJ01018662.1:21-3629(-)